MKCNVIEESARIGGAIRDIGQMAGDVSQAISCMGGFTAFVSEVGEVAASMNSIGAVGAKFRTFMDSDIAVAQLRRSLIFDNLNIDGGK